VVVVEARIFVVVRATPWTAEAVVVQAMLWAESCCLGHSMGGVVPWSERCELRSR
jgi:hypothetical protein